MTRTEWLTCPEPRVLLRAMKPKLSDRQRRLLYCGCARLFWPWLVKEPIRRMIEAVEDLADGKADPDTIAVGVDVARKVRSMAPLGTPWEAGPDLALEAALAQAGESHLPNLRRAEVALALGGPLRVCGLLRDMHNPFAPEVAEAEWLRGNGGAVGRLAQGIYERRSFDELPVLADGLEEVGCRDAEVLGHCRTPGEHFRGCWVLDLLLLQG
jgi:hypothetical protein